MKCLCCVRPQTYHCKIVLLDEQELLQEIQDTTQGQEILDTVFRHLNLLETSYFGLRYLDASNQTHWLDATKRIVKQLKGKDSLTLYFGVKFYAVDPCKLLEEITRYQFFLQVKQDILQGRLPVSFELGAELGAHVVQSELGDYDPRRHSPGYVSEFRFTSHQSAALESRVAELHRELSGQEPNTAELNYLDRVKSLPLYGVDLHPVLGEDSIEYFLGLTPAGIVVLRNKVKVASYLWPKITKIYSKGKYFMIRVCDKTDEENTYGFETPSRPACKHLYKCCVDHHGFFRLVQNAPNPPPDIISSRFSSGRGDKFPGSGGGGGGGPNGGRHSPFSRNPPSFTRTPSKRYQRRLADNNGTNDEQQHSVAALSSREDGDGGGGFVRSTSRSGGLSSGFITGGSVYGVSSELKSVSVPQPVHSMGYHPTRSDSPRSTRSAPWIATSGTAGTTQHRGLFSQSPRSVRSAGVHTYRHSSRKKRSSSVESRSSNESKHCRRRRRSSRGKRGSDNESEHSRCSSSRHRRRNKHHHSRSRGGGGDKGDAGSEREHRSRIKTSTSEKQIYELVDSESQWKQVQLRRASIQQAAIVRPKSGYMNSGLETESEYSYHHTHSRRKQHRKHSSRSRSPSECASGGSKPSTRFPPELAQALEFSLVDTEGMSAAQLRSIPYTEVKTSSRVKLSPVSGRKHHSHSSRHSSRSKSSDKEPLPPSSASVMSEPGLSSSGPPSLPPPSQLIVGPIGERESPPPPYSRDSSSSRSSLNLKQTGGGGGECGPSGVNEPQAQVQRTQPVRSSARSNTRHCSSALYSHPNTLLGNNQHSQSPWSDTQQSYVLSRRPSDHTLSSSSNSGRSSLRLSHSSSAQQFPTSSRPSSQAHPPPPPHSSNQHRDSSSYNWQNSEIRGVGLAQYLPMGGSVNPPSQQQRQIYNRHESISSDNLLEATKSDRYRLIDSSSSNRNSSMSSDNLLSNSTYVDEESRQCNELIDFEQRVIGQGSDFRKSNQQDQNFDRYPVSNAQDSYRSHQQSVCDNDNLALENRLQNIHLNANIIGSSNNRLVENRFESFDTRSSNENRFVDNRDMTNARLGSLDTPNNRLVDNRFGSIDARSSNVKVESGVLKRYTNTPSGGVIPWPGVNQVGYQGTNHSAGFVTNSGGSTNQNGSSSIRGAYQESQQPTGNSNPSMESGPNMPHQTIGPGERLGFQMDTSTNINSTGGVVGLGQELMNTLSDASTTWDGLPITQYNHQKSINLNSVANNNHLNMNSVASTSNVCASNGWADESHLSSTNISGISGIVPFSRSNQHRDSMNNNSTAVPGPLYYASHDQTTSPSPLVPRKDSSCNSSSNRNPLESTTPSSASVVTSSKKCPLDGSSSSSSAGAGGSLKKSKPSASPSLEYILSPIINSTSYYQKSS
uniref:Erythrocyte membrane protein band 4.1-like 4A n=1 Tax=Cacopsylla melanoneura TaxID=428564 RepID=A0A8D8QFX7_9HEMI